jgi:transcriptional regulator with XRE-family HTH domain
MAQTPTTFHVDGTAIRKRRMHMGLGTREAAERALISERYLNHLENGYRTRMRPGPYSRLRAALKANETELLAPHADPPERK